MDDERQYELMQEVIKSTGINVVTCGNCGNALLHKIIEQEIKCPYCGYESEPCDFPDLFY